MARNFWAGALACVSLLAFPAALGAVAPADSPAAVDGSRKVNSGDYRGAISQLQSAVSQNPADASAYYWLGRAFYELDDYDSSAMAEEKAVSLAPKNSEYHDWLGRAYGGKADRERSFFVAKKVKAEFQTAIKLDPSNIDARRDLEDYDINAPWIAGGNKDEAQAQVDAIAAIDPVEGHIARAIYDNEALKKPADAEVEYRAVLNAKSNHIEPYLQAANFFINENKPSDVLAAVNAAAAVAADDARLDFYRGVVAIMNQSDLQSAERNLKSYIASTPARSSWPSHAFARVWLGRLYEALGQPAAAAEQYRAALQLNPNQKEARARLDKLEKDSR
ncbi:MAG TPA: tetratricopeptide repeat protein [Candidatus Acidoferrales bacterium]